MREKEKIWKLDCCAKDTASEHEALLYKLICLNASADWDIAYKHIQIHCNHYQTTV